MISRYLTPIIFLIMVFALDVGAQSVKTNAIPLEHPKDHPIKYAWTGGLNAPQFSTIDLNFDGNKDLFIFDREGDRVLTFINNGTAGMVDYTYAPEYETAFPHMIYWTFLVDYNGDGKEDIFTHNQGGFKVFKNTSSAGTGISFTLVIDPYLITRYDASSTGNIYCSSQDIPAIVDVDNDGDIDILTFGDPSAQQVFFHENFAQDSGSLETFRFHLNTYCWGNFKEDLTTNKVTLNAGCPKSGSSSLHSGSTLLAFDQDGDGDKELLLGDLSYTNLVFLRNGGTKIWANMTFQDTLYPQPTPAQVPIFPAAFHLDVNNDGLKDLLVAPNAQYLINDIEGVWYYQNTGTASNAIFTLKSKHFMQDEMIDHGSGSYPVLFDYNFDGLFDLIGANHGHYNDFDNPISKLQLYRNSGSTSGAKFIHTDPDFGGISQINLNTTLNIPSYGAIPAFGDLDNDDVGDMIIGDYEGHVHLFRNNRINGISNFVLVEADYQNIDVGQYATPQIFDLNRDGLNDLIIGNQNGKLAYYQNIGTKGIPHFKMITNQLGNVNTKGPTDVFGYSQPYFFRSNGAYYLICGTESGRLYYYKDIDQNLTGTFTLADDNYLNIDAGRRSHVAMGDLDGNGLYDILVGNYGGGIAHYRTELIVGIAKLNRKSQNDWRFKITPLDKYQVEIIILDDINPNEKANITLSNITGQAIFSTSFGDRVVLDFSDRPAGLYLITVQKNNQQKTEKFISR